MQLHPDIQEVLLTEQALQQRFREVGELLSRDCAGKNPLLVGVLKGSVHFFAALAKNVSIDCEYDFCAASSYGDGTASSGSVVLSKDLSMPLDGRDVILIDDIMDSGLTLNYLCDLCRARHAASVKTCVMLDKPERRIVDIVPDYTCFTVPNVFVVGYGLDYCQKYRNLPYIGILKPEIYRDPPAKGE